MPAYPGSFPELRSARPHALRFPSPALDLPPAHRLPLCILWQPACSDILPPHDKGLRTLGHVLPAHSFSRSVWSPVLWMQSVHPQRTFHKNRLSDRRECSPDTGTWSPYTASSLVLTQPHSNSFICKIYFCIQNAVQTIPDGFSCTDSIIK